MNANGLINLVIHMVLGRVIRRGIDEGFNRFSRKDEGNQQPPAQPQQAAPSQLSPHHTRLAQTGIEQAQRALASRRKSG